MLSNNRIALGLGLLLAGCVGRGGHDAPRIADPRTQSLDDRYRPADRGDPGGMPGQDDAPPRDYTGDMPPRDYTGDMPPPGDDAPPPRTAPGARYAQPGTRAAGRPAPYRPDPRQMPADLPPPDLPVADLPPGVAAGSGPRGTSGDAQRYDAVGYASWYGEEMGDARTADGRAFDPGAITAAHRTLPLGSYVEVTALDTGRTVLVLINDRGPGARDREIDLSRGAAQALGLTAAMAPVRVRRVNPPPQDQMALRSGQPASPRIDAPPSLLAALRHRLPGRPASAAPPPRQPTRQTARQALRQPSDGDAPYLPPPPRRGAPATAGTFVQVAALSSEARAQALATALGGRVARAGSIYRVQIGPFASPRAAQQARDDVARRGYGDARIVQTN